MLQLVLHAMNQFIFQKHDGEKITDAASDNQETGRMLNLQITGSCKRGKARFDSCWQYFVDFWIIFPREVKIERVILARTIGGIDSLNEKHVINTDCDNDKGTSILDITVSVCSL